MRHRTALAIGAVAALFTVTACSGDDGESAAPDGDASPGAAATPGDTGTPQAAPEPELDSIPDVVATVNGVDITAEEFTPLYEGQFQQLALQAQQTGQPVDQDAAKRQLAENLVDTELLVQEAEDRGFEASQEDIDATLTELAESNGLGSAEEFLEALSQQGTDEAEVNEQLEIQVKVEQLITDEGGGAEVSQEELQEAYDEVAAQQEAMGGAAEDGAPELPPLEEISDQLEQQVQAENDAAISEQLVEEYRADADVEINV